MASKLAQIGKPRFRKYLETRLGDWTLVHSEPQQAEARFSLPASQVTG
jgi:hypothetical protein